MSNEPRAVARSTDPGTSWEAARSVQGITETQGEVLAILRRDGPLTDEGLVDIMGGISRQSPSGIRTRRSELVAQGKVIDTGKRIVGSTGRRMVVWGIPEPISPNPISPLRSAGRYVAPDGDPNCLEHGSTCRKVWHRGSPPVEQCSCGEGPVGHSDSHETSGRPGIVRLVREGKTDQYMNIKATRAASVAAQAAQAREDEEERKRTTPRVTLRAKDLGIGAVLCPRCKGTGGNLLEACYRCSGSGLT